MANIWSASYDDWQTWRFFRQMAVLTKAGVPVVRALQICIRQVGPGVAGRALENVLAEVRAGASLSTAFRAAGSPFTLLHVSTLEAGERAGKLSGAFAELAHWEEKEDSLRKRLKAALGYPVFILVVSLIGIVMLIKFLVPVVVSVSEQLDHPPGWPTKFLIGLGELFSSPVKVVVVVGLLSVFVYGVIHFVRTKRERQVWWDGWRLRIPFVGPILQTSIAIRVCRSLSSLLQSGLSLVDALQLVGAGSGSIYVEEMYLQPAARYVRKGESLSQALKGADLFSPSFHGMVAVGERSGQLELILLYLADLYEMELDQRIETFMRILEPMAVIGVGAVVLLVMLSAFLPIYELVEHM